ncbi:MAG: molybdopterin-dependent oxidoreductase, partial [Candidatus Sumerlaeota bacterium]|nr:molybdopterin-dependent oxidoreductase [Candidatus Sumerlaeota bacterium]
MNDHTHRNETPELGRDTENDRLECRIEFNRRGFLQALGAGLLITVSASGAQAPGGGRGGRGGGGGGFGGQATQTVAARLHIGEDGVITVMTGKIELGQGPRTIITQGAAEELRVPASRIRLVMADTELVPDDGVTAGSQTTPRTMPAVRAACATARNLLADEAARRWQVDRSAVEVRDGAVSLPEGKQTISYADLAKSDEIAKAFQQPVSREVELTPAKDWKVLGASLPRPNARDIVTGAHRYASDIVRPDMLYGKVLRPPSYGATLASVDTSEAEAMKGVVVVHEGDFVGCAAPTSFLAAQAVKAIAAKAQWNTEPFPSSKDVSKWLKDHGQQGGEGGGGGFGGRGGGEKGSVKDALAQAGKTLKATYEAPYVQHSPMETRAAVAEWKDGKLTVWAGSQSPFSSRSEIARELNTPPESVHVIVPDTGGAFGGKHSTEAGVEAARLAKAAGKPVHVKWTREEEFTWAYFRPAVVIDIQAALDAGGKIVAWEMVSYGDSMPAGIQTPYDIPNTKTQPIRSNTPLKVGAYRCLGATVNNWARESMMDELAAAAGADPLEFRLAHLT